MRVSEHREPSPLESVQDSCDDGIMHTPSTQTRELVPFVDAQVWTARAPE